ncbi:MAG: hypothetical protein J0H46_18605 [Bacteroidetes bacterium]|nr:hypothetical protein [Bacteroidota bacterium]
MKNKEASLAVFTRFSKFVVERQVKIGGSSSYEYVGQLINNMQEINQSLMLAAIKLVKKLRAEGNIYTDELIVEFRNIIHGCVSEYAQRA